METINNLNSLHAFVQVAKKSSFSAAAKEMNVSKAYISKMVQSLEQELNQKLLTRTTRLVKLTREGERFFDQCEEALQKILAAKKELMLKEKTPRGVLRVTLAGVFGEEYITPIALSLMKNYPELSIELSFTEKLVDLIKEDYDIAIRVGELNDSSLKAYKIAVRKEYLCASPKYLKEYGHPKTPDDLRNHKCLVGSSDQWTFQEKKSQRAYRVKGQLKSNNGRVLLKATLQGFGISKLPGVYVKEWIDKGKLTPLLQDYLPHEIPIWAITSADKADKLKTKIFLEALENVFGDDY